MVQQYLHHAREVLTNRYSVYQPNRTGVDTISLFGYKNEYDLSNGFPLITTKKIDFGKIAHELIWFLSGSSNIKYLVDNDVHIWDDNAFHHYLKKQGLEKKFQMYGEEWKSKKREYISRIKSDAQFGAIHGDLGPVYGKQWRHWKTSDGMEIDQLDDALALLKKSPNSRRIIVTAWNPEEIPNMALPPCHLEFQLNIAAGRLDCMMVQRSADMFLGVPFNIASYSALTHVLAQEADLLPGRFIHDFGNSHFYCGSNERGKFYGENLEELKLRVKKEPSLISVMEWIKRDAPPEQEGSEGLDHVTGILEQLLRQPRTLPRLEIARKKYNDLKIEDFMLEGYAPYPAIRRKMAV